MHLLPCLRPYSVPSNNLESVIGRTNSQDIETICIPCPFCTISQFNTTLLNLRRQLTLILVYFIVWRGYAYHLIYYQWNFDLREDALREKGHSLFDLLLYLKSKEIESIKNNSTIQLAA